MSRMKQIKASAGSGKTHQLTLAFLRLLAGCSEEPGRRTACAQGDGTSDWRGIMAITFTNAAAAEMQDRVILMLKERALGKTQSSRETFEMSPRQARIWLERILHDKSSLSISTIDSLLNLILRMSALSENLPPDFTPVFTSEEITGPYWEEFSNRAWSGDDELRTIIERICKASVQEEDPKNFLENDRTAARLAAMLPLYFKNRMGKLTAPDRFETQDGGGILPALRKSVYENALRLLAPEVEGIRYDKRFVNALEKITLGYEAKLGGKPDAPATKDFFSLKLDAGIWDSAYFYKKEPKTTTKSAELSEDMKRRFAELCQNIRELKALDYLSSQQRLHAPVKELADRIYDRWRRDCQMQGQVPNDTVPVTVKRILSTSGDVVEALCRLGNRLSHFLVDEFQDTSRAQWDALRPLVIEALSKGGSFTWVGDVKQAIYGFRGGDSQLFDDIAGEKELTRPVENGPSFELLDRNWRSHREIIAFNNALFASLSGQRFCRSLLTPADTKKAFEAELLRCGEVPDLCPDAKGNEDMSYLSWLAEKLALAYRDAGQTPSPRSRKGGRVRRIVFDHKIEEGEEEDLDEDDAVEEDDPELLAAAAFARAEHDRRGEGGEPGRWSDILVLVRTNRQALRLAGHFAGNQIPVLTENSLLLSEHPLIVQSIALLKFVQTPEDDVAFWTLVTGSILRRTRPDLKPEAERALQDDRLLELSAGRGRKNEDRRSLADIWQSAYPETWAVLFAPLLTAACSRAPYDLIAEWYEREDVWTRFRDDGAEPFLARFLEILSSARKQGLQSIGEFLQYWDEHGEEEKVPTPKDMDAVRIMTIHKAKGLQAKVVILPWTGKSLRSFGSLGMERFKPRDGSEDILCLARGSDLLPSGRARKLKESFEAVNLFYVACTRAQEALYLFVSEKPKGPGLLLEKLLEEASSQKGFPEAEPWEKVRKELKVGNGEENPAGGVEEDEHVPAVRGTGPLWDGFGRDGIAAGTDWMPRNRLPGVRQSFSFQDQSHPRDLAREEGIFVHECLEELASLPASLRRDPDTLAGVIPGLLEEGEARRPWLFAQGDFRRRAEDELSWFVRISEARGWLAGGCPEQSLTTASGRVLRTDLLVPDAKGPLVIEYKHGLATEELLKGYRRQVMSYLKTLEAVCGPGAPKPLGCLVFLKERRFHLVRSDGSSTDGKKTVRGDKARTILLNEEDFATALAGLRA